MTKLTTYDLKEIAEQLDFGLRAFIHKTTKGLLFVPDTNDLAVTDTEAWQDQLSLLDNNSEDYFEIEKMPSRQFYEMMETFTNQLTDNGHLQRQLTEALNKKHPFREFKFAIDNSGDYRLRWFDFKLQSQIDWVEKQLQEMNLDQ